MTLPRGWSPQDPTTLGNNPIPYFGNQDAQDQGPQSNTAINYNDPAWLKSIGYSGPAPMQQGSWDASAQGNTPNTMDPAFQQFLQGHNLSLGFNADPHNYNLAAFDPTGKQVGSKNSWAENDDPGNLFLMAMLGAGGFGIGAAAGIGAGAGEGLATDATGATVAPGAAGEGYGAAGYSGSLGGAEAGGVDSASLGSDAHFYQPGGPLLSGINSAYAPALSIPSTLGSTLQQVGKLVGGKTAGGDNILQLLTGGSGNQMSAGDRFRQQLTAQALRDAQSQQPAQAMPGWIPGS